MSNAVLVVSAVSPVPVDNGRRVFLNGLLRYLVTRFGEQDVHYAVTAHPDVPMPDLPGQFHRLPVPSALEKLWNVGAHTVVQRQLSIQEALLTSRHMRDALTALIAEVQPRVEFYDTIRMGQHRVPSRPGSRQILHLDDLYTVRYGRMLETEASEETTIDPLGEFADKVPGPFRQLARKPAVYRRLLSFEASRLGQRERTLVHDFDLSTLMNHDEVASLRRESGCSKISPITTTLPPQHHTANRWPSDTPEFVFLGRLNVPHNDDAICTFLDEVMPNLVKARPETRLTVVGGGASAKLEMLAGRFPENVSLEGFVDDIDPIFARATAVIAPLRFGSGVKTKVLEALVRGVPVVGTTIALEGIHTERSQLGGTDGTARSCTIEDDLALWPKILLHLMDPQVNTAASDAAARDGAGLYSQKYIYAQYDEIFQPWTSVATTPNQFVPEKVYTTLAS